MAFDKCVLGPFRVRIPSAAVDVDMGDGYIEHARRTYGKPALS